MNANPLKYHNLSGNICSAGIDPNLIRFKRSLAVTAQIQRSGIHACPPRLYRDRRGSRLDG